MSVLVLSLPIKGFWWFQGMKRYIWTWRSCFCYPFPRKTLILDENMRKTYPIKFRKQKSNKSCFVVFPRFCYQTEEFLISPFWGHPVCEVPHLVNTQKRHSPVEHRLQAGYCRKKLSLSFLNFLKVFLIPEPQKSHGLDFCDLWGSGIRKTSEETKKPRDLCFCSRVLAIDPEHRLQAGYCRKKILGFS